ncbi:ABC transporter ATP-binding protein [Halomicroarcula sp. GCM10025324]|uniref:ABC transporter ATP-binding protein n=1 Tax=Haloarcula TaxID=2237 RepID=UPI0023E7BDFE|nr:ABC transporter ATP-binding protein [Halomicroarcula sp. ZS-22-S1]
MTEDLLRVRNLKTRFFTAEGQINAVENVSFDLRKGEVFGIVGESGSGKSVTGLSVIDLIESPGRIVDGEIWYRSEELATTFAGNSEVAVDGEFVDLRTVPQRQRDYLRGTAFSMVFQDPLSSFNPSLTVGEQIAEAVESQRRASANPRSTRTRTSDYGISSFLLDSLNPWQSYVSDASKDRAVELLARVDIPDPARRAEEYPHQFSGGMLQRAMIAQALAVDPDILIADEPTTALDVTIQAQLLELLSEMQAETDMSILLITHNLGVIARLADRIGVMYAGEVVERGPRENVLQNPHNPYTVGLLNSIPRIDTDASERKSLEPIAGNVPSLQDSELGDCCYFADRCPERKPECTAAKPRERSIPGQPDHQARCVLVDESGPSDESDGEEVPTEPPVDEVRGMNVTDAESRPGEGRADD